MRYYWDLFVLVLALYNSVMTPFQFSFDYVMIRQELQMSPFYELEYAIDFIYVIDIIIGFLTSYIDQFTGDEIFELMKIARYYMGNDFVIDFISTFYFAKFCVLLTIDKQVGENMWQQLTLVFQVFKLLKVLRLRKVSKLIRGANATIEAKAVMQVGYFTLILIIYTHVVACVMWHMLKTDKKWVPSVDFGAVQTVVFSGYERIDREAFDFFLY